MSAMTGFPPSTVHSWKRAGRIPAQHQGTVLGKAQEASVELSPADFFDLPDRRVVADRRAGDRRAEGP